jgi:hydroxymethylpyrimidine/phosphomethylpyrimidine kinase
VRVVALTIAGSDPSGGGGLQADLVTFARFGVHGASVAAALTAQDTRGVRDVLPVPAAFVGAQLDAVRDDLDVRAAKTGMLLGAAVVDLVAHRLRRRPVPALVVDPVVRATSGDALLDPDALGVLRTRLLPLATLVTPNLDEAEALTGRPVVGPRAMRDAARALVEELGARAALVKGGHAAGAAACDVLYDGRAFTELAAPRVPGGPVRGTGCALSAAVTAGLALGADVESAVAAAKRWVTGALAAAEPLGRGARLLDPGSCPAPEVPKRG